MLRHAVLAAAGLAIACPVASAQRAPSAPPARVPKPASVLGFEPATDRRLPPWRDIVRWFEAADRASPRMTVRTLGNTTLGRPFIAAFIGDPATLRDLPRLREIQRRLADPRLRAGGPAGDRERARLIAEGKTVVLVTSSIHSTEVGGFFTPLRLAHRLMTADDAESRAVRANTLVILVPSLNPDGVDIVGDWYRATVGTPAEGTSQPALYHHYVGHDNNRDWYAFTQAETRLTIDSLHSVWHPQIVNDIHQQGPNGSRIFIPPYMDPVEPNVDPILVAGVNAMGTAMAWRLTSDGLTGAVVNASYDAWTPARSYQHYHGGIRILTETASARLASPIDVPAESLRTSLGYDAGKASWNFPAPWPGGRWTLDDIVTYQTSATWALLVEAARDRPSWLESFARVHERAVRGKRAAGRADWPYAFVIPTTQRDSVATTELLRVLHRGQVEIRATLTPAVATSVSVSDTTPRAITVPAGSWVVLTAQPYGAFAKALLERQRYPNLLEYPGGPPKRPYDVTAHTLPLLMGVDVAVVRDSVSLALSAPIAMPAEPRPRVAGLSGGERRIALYRSYSPSMDEGWTRWIFDRYGIAYTSVTDRDLRAGNLRARFEALLLPDQSPRGLDRGVTTAGYPDSLEGGIGDAGARAVREFVERGGTLIALNEAATYAAEKLQVPVRDVLAGVPSRDFYGPGSLLRARLEPASPLVRGLPSELAIWYEGGPAWEITDPARAHAVVTYPPGGDPLLSGWLLGGNRLAGRIAMVDASIGEGRVILFGFRPQYRAQSLATYPLLFAALRGDR